MSTVDIEYHDYLTRVLTLAARTDTVNDINWTLGLVEDRVTFVVEIGNLFSETEWEQVPLSRADVVAFEEALRDVGLATAGDFTFGPALYACRLRGQRPCNMGWPTDPRVSRLFEEAGPKRSVGMPPPPPLSAPVPERQFSSMAALDLGLDAVTTGVMPAVGEPIRDPSPEVLSAGPGWPAMTVGSGDSPPQEQP